MMTCGVAGKNIGPWTLYLYHIIIYHGYSWIISMKHTSTHLRSPYWDGFSFQVSQPRKAKRQTTHLHPVPGPPPPFLPPFPPWLRSFTSTLHLHSSIQPGQETWREITNLQAKSDLGDPMSSHAQIETHFEIEYHRSNLGSVKTYRNLHTIPMYTPHIHTCKHHLFIKCSLNFGGGCHSHVQRLSQVTTMSTRTAIASFLRQLFAPWFPLWRPKIILRYVLMNQHCLRSALATSTSQYKTSTAN